MNSSLNVLRQKITPECHNMTTTITIINIVEIVTLIIVVAVVIFTTVYHNAELKVSEGESTDTLAKDKNKKIRNMLIAIAVLGALTPLLNLYTISIGNKLKTCIDSVVT